MPQLNGAIPAPQQFGSLSFSIIDSPVSGPAWSTGGQILVPVSVQQAITKPWTIYGWGLVLRLLLVADQIDFPRGAYGKLGKVIAGPIFGSGGLPQPATAQTPFAAPPAEALPNLATVWDGTQDPTPPYWSTGTVPKEGGRISFSTQLPIPISLGAGSQLGFALWLTPSLAGVITTISDASYIITYG